MGFGYIWVVIGLPLAGFLVQCFFGKAIVDALGPRAGKRVMGFAAVLPVAIAFGLGCGLTYELAQLPVDGRSEVLTLFSWISLKSISIPFEVVVDPLSMTMVLIVTGVGALIHLYATGYMAEDRDYTRFFAYMNLFIATMLVLVLGNNLPMLFIGWEGVGLCSYLLIGFWYKDLANARAANKAFIVNRIGDWGLTLGMFLLVVLFAGNLDKLPPGETRWLSYDVLIPYARDVLGQYPGLTTVIALLLFVGAMGKSAQFPLSIWLPDAMAGPTPVSALIHAATMVTAGVFLLNRLDVIFQLSPLASAIVAGIGALTALIAALTAFGQTDIKKVLAFSTVSQLGYMFIACGVGAYWVGMFHVTTHAFFKALLFLGAGAVIHAMAHEQDLRAYGRLAKWIPVTFATMIVGWLAISGAPYLFAGFWSKEAILKAAFGNTFANVDGLPVGWIAGGVGLFVALLTAGYMTRMTWLTFFGPQERWRLLASAHGAGTHGHHDPHAHGASHASEHADHAHAGPDEHGFYYTDEEMRLREIRERETGHHGLTPDHRPHEVGFAMAFPLVVLAILSTFTGWLLYETKAFQNWLYPEGLAIVRAEAVSAHPPFPEVFLVMASIAVAVIGAGAMIARYRRGLPEDEGWDLAKWKPWRRQALDQFGIDRTLMEAGVEGGTALAQAARWIDENVIDRGLVEGTARVTALTGGGLRKIQTGKVRWYAAVTMIGTMAFLAYLLFQIARLGGNQ